MQLVVIAKEPRPGFAKTRLCPPCTPDEAARLAAASLADTLAVVASTPATRRTVVLDGEPGWWMPDGLEIVPQGEGDLGERLDAALAVVFAASDEPAVLVGMDTPQITSRHLLAAAAQLEGHDAVLGCSSDGGWWLLGSTRYRPGLFEGVAMSEPTTGRDQLARLDALGLRVARTVELRDMDRFSDAMAIAEEAPGGRLAEVVAEVRRAAENRSG